MRYILTLSLIILFTLSACGRRGSLQKPDGEDIYPRQYPSSLNTDNSEEQI
ncbi:MAG: hypothetical protein IJ730_05240 [Alphaproteobacteria bacterium]|nr:hypothetical protein [Alphaproteobacteria bacterium]